MNHNPMYVAKTQWSKTMAAIFALSVTNWQGQLAAQENDEVFDLSPFTVESSDSEGYAATSTLAGTRLKTNLRDIASSISVVTKDFLEDTASTDLKELLIYTAGTEVIGPIGNLANEAGRTGENTVSEIFSTNTATTRVRGLASATLTRNYYESLIPMDSYNTERVTINRGANSILFGVGSPAGIINNGLVAPVFENRTELTGRVGSYGSYRGTFDIERVLVEDKLSVRVTGLYEDTKFQQDPAFEEDQRIFLAAAWKPTEDLTIRANIEGGNIDSNLPRQFPLVDMIGMWWDPLAHPKGLIQPTHDATAVASNGPYSRSYFGPMSSIFVPQAVWADPTSPRVDTSRVANGTAGMLNLKQPFWHPAGSPNRDADWWAAVRGTGRNMEVWNNGANSAISGQFTNHQITDTSIIDFRNHLIDGDTKGESLDFDSFNISAEHLFWEDNIGVEVAYDKQSSYEQNHRLLSGGRSESLQIDPTSVLPDGSTNPNLGRPLVGFNNGYWSKTDSESDVFRTTAFINLNISDWMNNDGWLSKIVGNHAITALYEDREASNFVRGGPQVTWGKDYAEFGRRADNGQFVNNTLPRPGGQRSFGGIVYLGDSLFGASSPAGANLQGSIPNLQIEDSYTITVHNYNTDSWENKSFSTEKNATTNARKDRLERESEAIIFSSRFLDDHIVATYGWRKDTINSFAETAPISDTQYSLLADSSFQVLDTSSGDEFSDTTFSWGVVGHAPQSWIENLPVDSFSIHYASAENRVASGRVRHDVFGRDLSSPLGETEEYGFTVSFLENNLSIRANWFETVQALRTETDLSALNGLIPFILNRVGENARAVIDENFYEQDDIENLANYPAQPPEIVQAWNIRDDGTGSGAFVWTAPDNLATTSDGVSKGFELEMVGNLARNWTVSLNAVQVEVTRSNTAPEYQEYLYGTYNQAQLWGQDKFGKYPSALGNAFNIGERIELIYESPFNLARLQDGAGSVDQIREWRWNLFTNYRFDQDSKLKGWSVGGGARWQDEIAIGHPQIFDNDLNAYKPDINNPHFGPSELNIDSFVRYKRKIMDDKVDMTLTLNIRNLFDDDDLIPVAANPNEGSTGLVAIWRIPTERTYSLSARFSF
ncbi:MAG: TonB-dependent receptor plug domain-containing protein [Verrucomicrobia bacterium]|nr:TonB-dependent receptor plug domain-containing protein [Verrucomicrobiota bacterium]MDA1069700.1 TonB-dependent receptor plug domain-containing protein [Verrucomicrobiota bacterium]